MALTDNLVAYWRLEESSGTRVDSSGNGRGMSPSGSPGGRTGKLNNAVDFVPASYLSNSDAAVSGAITDSAGWTLAGWLYSDNNATHEIFGCFNAFKGLEVYFIGGSRDMTAQWWSNASGLVVSTAGASFTSGAWNFFAMKYDPGTDKLYARSNGTTNAGASCAGNTFTQNAGTLYLGKARTATATSFDGGMDDIGLWSRALSGAELDQLYNSGAGLDPTVSTGSALPLFAAQLMAMR
ncbi:MAG: LamG domain-containing protein [Ardenticatenia bacterium]|nr:LamG domain-containing protein [Ardenticatenia bacterium]